MSETLATGVRRASSNEHDVALLSLVAEFDQPLLSSKRRGLLFGVHALSEA